MTCLCSLFVYDEESVSNIKRNSDVISSIQIFMMSHDSKHVKRIEISIFQVGLQDLFGSSVSIVFNFEFAKKYICCRIFKTQHKKHDKKEIF